MKTLRQLLTCQKRIELGKRYFVLAFIFFNYYHLNHHHYFHQDPYHYQYYDENEPFMSGRTPVNNFAGKSAMLLHFSLLWSS